MECFHKTGKSIKISKDGKTISNVSNTHASCYGFLSIPSNEPYCHIWKFQIVSDYNQWTSIGIDASDHANGRFYVNHPQSYAYRANGDLFAPSRFKIRTSFQHHFKSGDVLEMILNLAAGYLGYRITSKAEHHPIHEAIAFKSIPQEADVEYHMAVSLSCSGDSVTLLRYSNNKQKLAQKQQKITEEKEFESLKTEVQELQKENAVLKVQLVSRERELRNLSLPKILNYESIEEDSIHMKEVVIKEQKSVMQEINIHNNRLKQWQCFSQRIRKLFESVYVVNDEEKTNTKHLLDDYASCKQLWEQQERRMEEVIQYCHALNQLKKGLKAQSQLYHEKVQESHKLYNELLTQYKNCNSNRIKSEILLKEMQEQTVHAIEEENTSNDAQCKAFDDYNVHNLESKNLDKILTNSIALIKGYTDFDTQNEQQIQRIKSHFNQKWIAFLKDWYYWSCDDVICWVLYLRKENKLTISKQSDLETIRKEIKRSNVNGKLLCDMSRSSLKSLGFVNFSENQQIYKRIHELISKYRHREESVEGDDTEVVPKQFLCPLSKEIMKKPVKIFDNHTYERTVIAAYLEKHHKSPITNETCDTDDFWMLPNRILQQKIEIFLSAHPEFDKKETDFIK